ncbi:hypothetical protein PILCRDRAFT_829155 [Piloderma croceum F 1598]|uniref:Uncharacterized protein n=1 Tax=Piloderma croceum (strain F 1598) TaxID=765440 RepID=A0A0C3EZR7_PILCF|nr:hypothetical protein PILCRDRAFT_829155 [Piloderma croceum F 1598]
MIWYHIASIWCNYGRTGATASLASVASNHFHLTSDFQGRLTIYYATFEFFSHRPISKGKSPCMRVRMISFDFRSLLRYLATRYTKYIGG